MKKTRGRSLTRLARSQKQRNKCSISDGAILAIFLIVVLFVIFFFSGAGTSSNSAAQEQKTLLNKLMIHDEREDGPAIVVGDVVDDARVKKLASTDYSEIKKMVGITSDFVIYFEDDNGNVVNIAGRPCIGSSYAQVNGVNCNP